MIKVFYGNDRTRMMREVRRFLATENYETIEGTELTPEDLPNILRGTSLFEMGKERAILILDPVKSAAGEFLADYADTEHKVAIVEAKPDVRLSAWKRLIKVAEAQKFEVKELDTRTMFEIYRVARRDGEKAVKMLEGIQVYLEPKAFIGVMASQAFKDYAEKAERGSASGDKNSTLATRAGGVDLATREKRALKELAKLDMNLNEIRQQPWLLVQAFLLQLSSW